jgi:DNA-binding response OmpR family regulator
MHKKSANRQINKSLNSATNGFRRHAELVHQALIVDDDAKVRETLSWILEGMKFSVSTAKNGKEALKLFKKHDFEIVITDLNMPNMDGMALARYIKEWSPQTPIILVSGGIKKSARVYRTLADCVLHKPFGIGDLETAVRKTLAKAESLRVLRANASS